MLTEKDYCDYDTCVALKELDFNSLVDWYFNEDKRIVSSLARYRNTYIPRISLYEAQKWLREEEGLFVNVELFGDYDRDADGKTLGTWVYYSYGILNTTTADFIREYDLCTEYQTYEEALLEGIKEAIKILKEEK